MDQDLCSSDDDLLASAELSLDLEKWQICTIWDIRTLKDNNTLLELKSMDGLSGSVELQYPWTATNLKIGDIVIVGSLVHKLFQDAVLQASEEKIMPDLHTFITKILTDVSLLKDCYGSNISLKVIQQKLHSFVPEISSYIKTHVIYKSLTFVDTQKKNLMESIDPIEKVLDIEEYVCSSKLGLKGKVDLTVKLKNKHDERLPLELKTGKLVSNEHKAQLQLYIAIMKEIGLNVSSGLIFYLQERKYTQMQYNETDIRDLVILRNELMHYLRYQAPITCDDVKSKQFFTLPPPIEKVNSCKACELNVCCFAFLRENCKDSPLSNIIETTLSHLTPKDFEYFLKWIEIIRAECSETTKETSDLKLERLWSESLEKRMRTGNTVNGLILIEVNIKSNPYGSYCHIFNLPFDALHIWKNFAVGDCVAISSSARVPIVIGTILHLTSKTIETCLEYDLRRQYAKEEFVLDKLHYASSGLKHYFTNMGIFMQDDYSIKKLRWILTEIPPSFYDTLIEDNWKSNDLLKQLNSDQASAALKALSSTNYMLIHGYPGTGKTETLTVIIQLLLLMGQSVIVTSHTNSAVDNVLIKLKQKKLNFLRIGRFDRISFELVDYCDENVTQLCSNVEELEKIYDSYNIIGTTCYSINHPLFSRKKFDVCIVDEATQIMQSAIIGMLSFAEKFILIGDPEQLPPVVKSRKAKILGGDISIFSHLENENSIIPLTVQYRMNGELLKVANSFTYNGLLKCGSEEIYNKTFKAKPIERGLPAFEWLEKAYSDELYDSIVLFDTGNTFYHNSFLLDTDVGTVKRTKTYVNIVEAIICITIVKGFILRGITTDEVGIICSYREQSDYIKTLSVKNKQYLGLEVSTIDQFQGKDKKIIIYSGTKTRMQKSNQDLPNDEHNREILDDHRRLNVAVTRAKEKFIMVSDQQSLLENTPFAKLFDIIGIRRTVRLGEYEASWSLLQKHIIE